MLFWKQTTAWHVLALSNVISWEKNWEMAATSQTWAQVTWNVAGTFTRGRSVSTSRPDPHRNALHYHWVLKTKWKVIQVKSCLILLWKRQSQKPKKWNKDQGFMERSSYWEPKQNNAMKGRLFIRRSFLQKAKPCSQHTPTWSWLPWE